MTWLDGVKGFGALGAAFSWPLGVLDPVFQFVVATADQWFTIVAVATGSIGLNVDWIPNDVAVFVLVAAATVYGTIKLAGLYDRARERF